MILTIREPNAGATRSVEGEPLTKHFAAWRLCGNWSLTHIPTGLAVVRRMESLADARDFAEWLESKYTAWGDMTTKDEGLLEPVVTDTIRAFPYSYASAMAKIRGGK